MMGDMRGLMLRRGIRKSLNRFLSIMGIVALGSGFLAGLTAATPDMELTCDQYLDDSRFYDLDIKSTLGLTSEDAALLAARPGVSEVLPAAVTDAILLVRDNGQDDGSSRTARIYAMLSGDDQAVNRLTLLSGRMPQASGECVVQSPSGYTSSIPAPGAELAFSPENTSAPEGHFTVDGFTVVGVVTSPMFISVEQEPTSIGSGSIALGVYVLAADSALDYATDLYVIADGAADMDAFSDSYFDHIASLTDSLTTFAGERTAVRSQTIASQLADSESGLNTLRAVTDQLTAALADDQAQLNTLARSLAYQQAIVESAAPLLSRDKAGEALTADERQTVLRTQAAQSLCAALQTTLEAMPQALTRRAADLAVHQKRLTDGENALSALRKALTDAAKRDAGAWYLRDRRDNVGFSSYKDNIEKVAALAKVFPVFFFLVALLVALTTMTRMVEEERTQIGGLKALGYTNLDVLSYYLLYSLLSSLIGSVIGVWTGFKLFPAVISNAYAMMYTLPETLTPFSWSIAAGVTPATVGGILLATLAACLGDARATPAALMTPKAPKAGKRTLLEGIPFVWNRFSFLQKVTARNLFRYKKRLFMMLISVAGCSALLVTGFGLRDSINDIVDKQFFEIYRYNLSLTLQSENAPTEDEALSAVLADTAVTKAWLTLHQESGKLMGASGSQSLTLIVPSEPERLTDFIALRDRRSQAAVPFDESSVILTEKIAEDMGLAIGDRFELETSGGQSAEFTLTGVTENYVGADCYLSPAAYADAFGAAPGFTTLLAIINDPAGDAHDALAARILESKQVLFSMFSSSIRNTFSNSVKSIDFIVIVLILCAGLLAVIVLYSLNNVNICERLRELATLKVLGFRDKELHNYVFRESNLLSLCGTLVGLAVGVLLHGFVIRTVEVNGVMFGREIAPLSFVYAAAISMAFSLTVNRIMRRRIDKIDMVESLKSVE